MNKLLLFFKGMFMGAADIIPGVSGGSIALITGIYDELINSISSVKLSLLKNLLKGDLKTIFKSINAPFLVPVLLGILTSIFSMARLMNYLLEEQTLYTWSGFFGLILSSAYVISKHYTMTWKRGVLIGIGAVLSYLFVGLVPAATPNTLWFLFFSGAIAICAMILPGISGAFLLLILGKYHYITEVLKNPFDDGHILVIITVGLGCVTGVLGFSKFLNYLLKHWHAATMAFLTGMMLGSLRKIWPYKAVVETKVIDGDVFVVSEKLLTPWHVDGFFISVFFMILGIVIILILDHITSD